MNAINMNKQHIFCKATEETRNYTSTVTISLFVWKTFGLTLKFPWQYNSKEWSGTIFVGSNITFLTEGCPGKVFPFYPWNSGSQ